MYACYNYRSEEERDLWIRKLRLVIADECGRRRTYDFDVEFPKLYSDPHVKSMYKYTHALLLRFQHNRMQPLLKCCLRTLVSKLGNQIGCGVHSDGLCVE